MTIPAARTLLAVARTVTSTGRVLDAVQLLRDDPRVQVVFTFNDTSPFSDGVSAMLRRAGARMVPWSQVPDLRFDAVVAASENTELQAIDAPVLVLQHGVGFHSSMSLLAAGAGVPLLLAPLADEVVSGTPMTLLSRFARRLDLRLPLAQQIADTVSGYATGQYAEAVDATFAVPPAARPLRELLYELLGLPEPGEPIPLAAWPPPVPEGRTASSFAVHTRVRDRVVDVPGFLPLSAAMWPGRRTAGMVTSPPATTNGTCGCCRAPRS